MFVRKLVEKASSTKKYGGSSINSFRIEDVNPRLTFHYGIPAGSSSMAYDSIQHILAIATDDGRIKLFGRENTQALLQSEEAVPSKFLQFLENQSILLNVNTNNNIEVWDVDARLLRHVYMFNKEITSFAILQRTFYMYIGNYHGDVSILRLDHRKKTLLPMQYRIPFLESHGISGESMDEIPAMHILLQPMAEMRRVLIIFRDGLISLWGIQESKVLFTGGTMLHSSFNEAREVVSACWVCKFGSKVAVGYSNGELFIWAIPVISEKNVTMTNKKEIHSAPNIPFLKLNLGYKMDKIPISSLRWVVADGRSNRLYINGVSDMGSYSFQVIILNDKSESRTVKLGIPLTEACIGMEIISSFVDVSKQKKDVLVLLLKSGHLYLYNDSEIESYLLKSQSKSNPLPPNHVMAKLPYYDRRITSAKLYASFLSPSSFAEEDNVFFPNKFPHFLSVDRKENMVPVSARFEGFAKIKRFYITGHQDGAINFWDASFPLFVLMLSIKPQSEEDSTTSVMALHFELSSQVLICGDQSGSVRIISFKREQTASEHILSLLQAKQGANYTIQTIKLKGAILSLSINPESKHLAVGTDKGYVFLIDIEGSNILYQKQFPTQIYTGVISLQFENCNHNGYVKNVLLVATEESSVIAVEEDSGNELSSNGIHTKKPCRCLLMQILDVSPDGICTAHCRELNQENYDKDNASNQSLLLLCSENAVRIYSLNHAVQGIKKSHCKKKLSGSCCFASIICGHSSEIGLALFFTTGKLEIRSLPDLTLLKESTARGVINSASKPSPNLNATICSSSEGELIIVNGDQEISFFSVLLQDGLSRNVESINKLYRRDVVMPQESSPMTPKEKKKGIFSMVVKDSKASKSKNKDEHAPEDSPTVSLEDLAAIFSTANFPLPAEGINDSVKDEEKVELDINDIELEDNAEKPKGMNFSVLTKQNLGKKLQEIRGILKPKSEEKLDVEIDKNENEKATGSINQIKKKYGYAASKESNAPSIAKEKLKENTKKLQDTGARSSEMHDTAQSFSSMAKELLRISHK